jgi:serine/threonine-protein kinase
MNAVGRVLDPAMSALEPPAPTRPLAWSGFEGGARRRQPLALLCQERYQRQRLARGRVMLSLPDPDSEDGLSRQLGALAAQGHPDVLPIEDWGTDNGIPYAVTMPPPADSLSAAIVEGRARGSAATELLAVIAAAVDHAHERGVVHGCLEPAAVLLQPNGRPLVADFGLASLVASAPPPSGVCYLDSAYVAPERMLGRGPDRASDVYAFAAIVYELLTGQAPFAGVAHTADQVYALVDSDPVRPSALDRSMPESVDEIVMGGLARDPAYRWQSCTAMLNRLEWSFEAPPALAASLQAPAPEFTFPMVPITPEPAAESPARRTPPPRIVVGMPPRGATRRNRGRNRHPLAKGLAFVILCALAAVAGAMLVPTGQPGEQDLFGLPSLRQHLPPDIVQLLGVTGLPGTTSTATPAPSASAPAPKASSAAGPGPSLSVNPTRANRGGAVNVTGTGFNGTQRFEVNLTQGGADYQLQPATPLPANGTFSVSVTIPGQATPGAATIEACSVNAGGTAGPCTQQQITIG